MINRCGWLIGIQPIDDFQRGPRALIIKKDFHFSLFFRVRPLYIRFKIWLTRKSLVSDIHEMYAEGGAIWTPSTFEYGSLRPEPKTVGKE